MNKKEARAYADGTYDLYENDVLVHLFATIEQAHDFLKSHDPAPEATMVGMKMPSESARAYFYRVGLAVIPLLTLWGVVSESEAPLYVALGGAVLSTGLAAKNTSR